MSTLRTLYHLARADFLERARRYSFLVILALTIAAGYFSIPPPDAGYVTLNLGGYRGVYNSAWIGGLVAILTTLFLWFFGFYLVKNAVQRDERTGVGEIIATTPLRKLLYVLGKWLSNFSFLGAMVAILALAALVMQLIRGEGSRIELWALWSPFLFVALPTIALVAATALLFETIPGLRGGFGNVVYFIVSPWVIVVSARTGWDILGIGAVESSIVTALTEVFPDYDGSFGVGLTPLGGALAEWLESMGFLTLPGELRSFTWEGITWTPQILVGRLAWMGVALGLVLVAALLFHRFDPAHSLFPRYVQPARPAARRSLGAKSKPLPPELAPDRGALLTAVPVRFRFREAYLAELRLMGKECGWWWTCVLAGLVIASLIAPLESARQVWLPAAWLWPLLLWSAMGTREAGYHTAQLVLSTAHPLRRQLLATWLAGVTVAALAGSGVAVHLLLDGEWAALLAWIVGAFFIPSLALALGCWSSSSKLFEVVYILLWYSGPLNRVGPLDFMGVMPESVAAGTPLCYLGLTPLLLGLAVVGRRRQLQM